MMKCFDCNVELPKKGYKRYKHKAICSDCSSKRTFKTIMEMVPVIATATAIALTAWAVHSKNEVKS